MRHVFSLEPFHPIRARFFFKKIAEGFGQLVIILAPIGPRAETRIVDQFRMAGGFA